MTPVFLSAPHRVMFAAGSVQLVVAMVFWLPELLLRAGVAVHPLTLGVPPAWGHGGSLVFGVFPLFIFGFLMTALPKWMAAPPLEARQYLPAFFLLAAGWASFLLGLFVPFLLAPGVVLAALGQAVGTATLAAILRRSESDRRHGSLVVAALAIGVVAEVLYAWALLRGDAGFFRWAIEAGLWGCVAPVFVTVLHRMLPFFTGAVVPRYRCDASFALLVVLLLALLGHGLAQALNLFSWRWLCDGVVAGAALRLSWQWQLRAGLKAPMLAMLHLGALWLGVGFGLYTLQSLLFLAGIAWGGLLPLHAVGAGFFTSVLIGMAARVTRGHSGRPISDDRWAWPLFRLFQGVVVLRLLGEFFPGANVAAGLGWLVIFGILAALYLPMYLRPRPDGQPG
ncbi:MAG: NnrS family protein [Dechloromonas sp.]|nr:NnrS family protein [Dechloromonas sp.]